MSDLHRPSPWLAILALGVACESIGDTTSSPSVASKSPEPPRCTIPCNEIDFDLRRADQIPTLDRPRVVDSGEAVDLFSDDLVIGVEIDGAARAYPLRVLARHELIHDVVGGRKIAVVYAPLTGASTVVDLEGTRTPRGFDNTGGLFNGDLILSDRETGSWWSHLRREAIRGSRSGAVLAVIPSIRTTLETWRRLHPSTTVVNTDTGHHDIDYDGDPYAWYVADEGRLLSPLRFVDLRLRRKEGVLGLKLGSSAVAWTVSRRRERWLVADEVDGQGVVVVGDGSASLAVALSPVVETRLLTFELLEGSIGSGPILRDKQTSSLWSIDGSATAGPLKGTRLQLLDGQFCYWFAWAAFHSGTSVRTAIDRSP